MRFRRAPVDKWASDRRYAIIIDAGSSGSRVQVYSWKDHTVAALVASSTERASLARIEKGDESGEKWMKKIHPGISSFADNAGEVGEKHLKKLYKHALKLIPPSQVKETPVYLLATAGMRLVSPEKQRKVMEAACRYTQKHYKFLVPECNSHFQVITGEMEGLYGWIAVNYLLGGFDSRADGRRGTYGFLDMGGASAQIAFAPNTTEAEAHANDLTLLRLRTLAGDTKEWRVFVSTWLGFGANEARRRHIERIVHTGLLTDDGAYPDPCMPHGLLEDVPDTVLKARSTSHLGGPHKLKGTGSLNQCLTALEPLLSKDAPCPDPPCLFAGVHVPGIDFDINHFVGISEYYYSAQDVFGLGGAYDYHTLSNAVETYCGRNWTDIESDLDAGKFPEGAKKGKLESVCFKASWIMNVLHGGIGIPRVTKEIGKTASHNGTEELLEGAREKGFAGAFNSAESLAGTEVSWTLGKMVLYASSSVPSESQNQPVGFGPNLLPAAFKPAGELPATTATGISGHVANHQRSAIAFFVLLFLLLAYMFKGPRKASIIAGINHLWLRRRKVVVARGEQLYERLEEGAKDTSAGLEMNSMSPSRHGRLLRTASFANDHPLSRTASQLRLNRHTMNSRDVSDDEGKLA